MGNNTVIRERLVEVKRGDWLKIAGLGHWEVLEKVVYRVCLTERQGILCRESNNNEVVLFEIDGGDMVKVWRKIEEFGSVDFATAGIDLLGENLKFEKESWSSVIVDGQPDGKINCQVLVRGKTNAIIYREFWPEERAYLLIKKIPLSSFLE